MKRTDIIRANMMVTLAEIGFGVAYIAKILEVPVGTVHAILKGSNGWARLLALPAAVDLRANQKKVIDDASTRLAVLAMKRIEKHLPKAMLEEAATVLRVMLNLGGGESGPRDKVLEEVLFPSTRQR